MIKIRSFLKWEKSFWFWLESRYFWENCMLSGRENVVFVERFSLLLSTNKLNKIVTYDLDHAGQREDWSGFYLTNSTNVISEIYCCVLPTFCCYRSLARSFVLFSFHYPSVHISRIETFLIFQNILNFQIGITLVFNPWRLHHSPKKKG